MKLGMLFPGQGAQSVGMGKVFYDTNRLVQEYFETASSCLERNFVRLCFASSEKELTETANAQASIFLISASISAVLKECYDIVPAIVAGHSLGEYSALFAAGGLSFPDALYLIGKRAQAMERAIEQHGGGMIAVINLNQKVVEEVVARYNDIQSDDRVAEIVNYNTPRQVVVSGSAGVLEAMATELSERGARVISLPVAGAFHSRLMHDAEIQFRAYLTKVDIRDLTIPLVTNVTGRIITRATQVKKSLMTQMSSPVRWWQSMKHFADCDVIVQIGPGAHYAKMLQREWPNKKILSVQEPADIPQLLEALGRPDSPSHCYDISR